MRGLFDTSGASKLLMLFLLGPPALYLLAFLVVPYLNVFLYSFWRVEGYAIVSDFNLSNYAKFFDKPLYSQVLWNSILVASIVTVAATTIGYLLAFFLVFAVDKHRQLLYFLVIVPLWTSFLLRAFTWRLILGREGIINSLLQYIGITNEPISLFLYNRFSVCLTLTYIFIPFVTLPVFTALEKIPRDYIEASMDLGGSFAKTFRFVILPLSLPGFRVAGVVLRMGEIPPPKSWPRSRVPRRRPGSRACG